MFNKDQDFIFQNRVFEVERQCKKLDKILEMIAGGALETAVARIRAEPNKDKRDALKKKHLPAFMPGQVKSTDFIMPTGIVWFDIEQEGLNGVDVYYLKDQIKEISECITAFISPSNGLKFGLLTDFSDDSLDEYSINQRFITAYFKAKSHVKNFISQSIEFDDKQKSISQKCYLSHDPDCYYNPDCRILTLNKDCVFDGVAYSIINQEYDECYIESILSYIPKASLYDDRLPVNYSVLRCLGKKGIPVLLRHWIGTGRIKLEKDLNYQLKNCKYGGIGYLINLAKKYGMTEVGSHTKRNYIPTRSDLIPPPLLSKKEGVLAIQELTRKFFIEKNDLFINVTTGAGKSHFVLCILANEIPKDKKVLILVSSNKLGIELLDKFKKARASSDLDVIEKAISPEESSSKIDAIYRILRKRLDSIPRATFIQGKAVLCKDAEAVKITGGRIPASYCEKCYFNDQCHYLNQFAYGDENIRIAHHSEWVNEPSVWFHGVRHEADFVFPESNKTWKPDYIIVDENIVSTDGAGPLFDSGNKFPSTAKVIESVRNGKSLREAVLDHEREILDDALNNIEPSYPAFGSSLKDFNDKIEKWKSASKNYSVILGRLKTFCITLDALYLHGMWVRDSCLYFHGIKSVHDRYKDVPTLFLDATANKFVVEQLFPGVKFVDLNLQYKDDINIYQLANRSITKKYLMDGDNYGKVISYIKNNVLVQPYRSVGLITYSKISNADRSISDFDCKVASHLGISVYNHFGAIRGLDAFDDVDCLIILGRHFIGKKSTEELGAAIFGDYSDYESVVAEKPIRMKDGRVMNVYNYASVNPLHQHIHEHFSLAETKQAIGRARPVHGSAKDVYYFSNESLGLDVEIDDFFYLEEPHRYTTEIFIEEVKRLGYLECKPKILTDHGLSANDVKNHFDKIVDELEKSNIKLYEFEMKDSQGRKVKKPYKYFVWNESLLVVGNTVDGRRLQSFHVIKTVSNVTG